MDVEVDADKGQKLFFIHSRNSSFNSLVGDVEDDSEMLLSTKHKPINPVKAQKADVTEEEDSRGPRCKITVTGKCMCKLSLIFYLATCITVSALYVVFYGKNQALFGDAWIPGKPTHSHHPEAVVPEFQDLPYTEWMSQRWTYSKNPFSDWPSLPPEVDKIQQLVEGEMAGKGGMWLLTSTQLFFVRYLTGGSPDRVKLTNVGMYIDVDIGAESFLAPWMGNSFFLVTPGNITYVDCSTSECETMGYYDDSVPFDTALSSTFSLSDRTLWLGTNLGLYNLSWNADDGILLSNFSAVGSQPIHSLAWRSLVSKPHTSKDKEKKYAFLLEPGYGNHLQNSYACSSGSRARWTGSYWSQKEQQEFGVLVVGTSDRLHFYDGTQWWYEWVSKWENGRGGVIDETAVAMTFGPSGELYIANNVSLSRLNIDYTFDRIGPLQGLPYNQLTSLYVSPYAAKYPSPFGPPSPVSQAGTLWIGTAKGYALFDIQGSKFIGYHNGPRWLPGGVVHTLVGSGRGVVAVTDEGLAVVYPEEWTLEKKAGHYQSMLSRHMRPPGLVADCPLTNFTPSSCTPGPTDNDGLWTSWLAASEAFRYHVTQDPVAKSNAWSLFAGLKFLVNVTDIRGYMARSVVPENSSVDGIDWHSSVGEPGWRWRGNTSSDEVVGHMFAYPLIRDLLGDTEEQENTVEELLDTIMETIKEHHYVLKGVDNCTTRWGVWSPSQLNLNRSWSDERGLNSLQLMAYLLSTYRLTGDTQFLTAYNEMFSGSYESVATYYGRNMINQKITFPRDNNFSDDELSFLPYFVYFYTLKNLDKHQLEQLGVASVHAANLSLQRSWSEVRHTKSAPWTVIYAYSMNKLHDPALIEQLVWNLRTWPLELVWWNSTNSHRLDININPEQDRDFRSGTQSVHILPANERTQLRWNLNPFQLDMPGSSTEMDPGPWLLPYWMARWIGIL